MRKSFQAATSVIPSEWSLRAGLEFCNLFAECDSDGTLLKMKMF